MVPFPPILQSKKQRLKLTHLGRQEQNPEQPIPMPVDFLSPPNVLLLDKRLLLGEERNPSYPSLGHSPLSGRFLFVSPCRPLITVVKGKKAQATADRHRKRSVKKGLIQRRSPGRRPSLMEQALLHPKWGWRGPALLPTPPHQHCLLSSSSYFVSISPYSGGVFSFLLCLRKFQKYTEKSWLNGIQNWPPNTNCFERELIFSVCLPGSSLVVCRLGV